MRPIHWAMSAGAWLIVAAAATSLSIHGNTGGKAEWFRVFGESVLFAIPWVAASPLIVAVVHRVSLLNRSRRFALATHLAGGALWTIAAAVMGLTLVAWRDGEGATEIVDSVMAGMVRLRRGFWIDYFLYWGVVAVGEAIVVHRRLGVRERAAAQLELRYAQLEGQLTAARLQALRARLHPHFLFNALSSVTALVRRGDARIAISMLTNIGDVLRAAMNQDDTQLMPLRDELATVHRYLEIERLRFGDRLSVDVSVPAELMDVPVPSLILQPLVENAVRHGIARHSCPSTLRIGARHLGARIAIEIFNSGTLLADVRREPPRGLGLALTQSRLSLLYGADASFTLRDAPDGVVATLEIPIEQAAGFKVSAAS